MTNQRFVQAERAAWLGMMANLFLALLKGFVGYFSQSKALIADAAHSASDVVGSLAVLVGIRAAKLPPDEDHPYGNGKAEPIAAIVVSVLLMLVGFELGASAIKSMAHGVTSPPHAYAIYALLASIIMKEALFQYKFRLGNKMNSQALIANAWEHRSDVFSSIAALIGVGGALIGKALHLPYMYYLDPLAGLFVALLVLHMGYRLVTEAIHTTLDHVLHEEEAQELLNSVQTVQGVISVNELSAREHGHDIVVDLKISVDPQISVMEGHEIAKEVKSKLTGNYAHVSDVFVHVHPFETEYPYKKSAEYRHRDDTSTLLH